jgi:hypothetical protein
MGFRVFLKFLEAHFLGRRVFLMKKGPRLLISTVIFLIILAGAVFAAMLITERKSSYEKNAAFFEEAKADHLDVLFIGSSHVINGINPLVLYENYGITSYNLGGHGSLLQESYWQLIRALQYCKPDYVVVDAYMLEKNYQYLDKCYEDTPEDERKTSIEQLHLNMDAYPLSRLKIAAVNDLIEDKDIRNQFLFNFMVYHDRWKELEGNDFKRLTGTMPTNSAMGAEMRYLVKTDVDEYPQCEEGQVLDEHTVGEEYLMKIIDECQRDGIGILVTYLPFSAETKDQIAANTAETVAARYGIPCINMLKEDGIIDEATDLNDHGHLNVNGAVKVTNRIGEWFSQNADLADHRGDSEYSKWDELSADFHKEINDMLLSGNDIRCELNLLMREDVSSIVYVNNQAEAFHDEGIKHLIARLSDSDGIEMAAATEGPYILIRDAAYGKYEACGMETLENVATAMGELTYIPIEKNFRLLYPSSDEEINYLYDDTHYDEDIQILIYDNNSGEVLTHLYFEPEQTEYASTK